MSQARLDVLEENLLQCLSDATKSLDYQNKVFPTNTNINESKNYTKRIIETLAKNISHVGKLRSEINNK